MHRCFTLTGLVGWFLTGFNQQGTINYVYAPSQRSGPMASSIWAKATTGADGFDVAKESTTIGSDGFAIQSRGQTLQMLLKSHNDRPMAWVHSIASKIPNT
jgi:hypothetical protein